MSNISSNVFFILCEPQEARTSVETLVNALKSHGATVSSVLDFADGYSPSKDFIFDDKADKSIQTKQKELLTAVNSATYIVLYLTDSVLQNKLYVDCFHSAVVSKAKYCVIQEATPTIKQNGHKSTPKDFKVTLRKNDIQSIDTDAIIKNPKTQRKARQHLTNVNALPFINNELFADWVAKQILHIFCVKPMFGSPLMKSFLYGNGSSFVSDGVTEMFKALDSSPPETQITFLSFKSAFSEEQFTNKFLKDYNDICLPYVFTTKFASANDVKLSIESISAQLFAYIPDFQRDFAPPNYSLAEMFDLLIAKNFEKLKVNKKLALIYLSGIGIEMQILMNLLQASVLPKWMKVLVTCSNDVTEQLAWSKPNVNIITEKDLSANVRVVTFDEFSRDLPVEVDPFMLVAILEAIRNPIPFSFLAKLLNIKTSAILDGLRSKSWCRVFEGTPDTYMTRLGTIHEVPSANTVANIHEMLANACMHAMYDTSSADVNFALENVFYHIILSENSKLITSAIQDFMFVEKLVDENIFQLIKDLYLIDEVAEVMRITKEVQVAASGLRSLLKTESGSLVRDPTEFPTKLLLFVGHNSSLLLQQLAKRCIESSRPTLIPLMKPIDTAFSSEVHTESFVDRLELDGFISSDPFDKVICMSSTSEAYSSSAGITIVGGTDAGKIVVYTGPKDNLELTKTFHLFSQSVTSVEIKNGLILAASRDGSAIIVDLTLGDIKFKYEFPTESFVGGVFLSNDCILLCTSSGFKLLRMKMATLEVLVSRQVEPDKTLTCVASVYMRECSWIIGCAEGTLITCTYSQENDLVMTEVKHEIPAHLRGITTLSTAPGLPNTLVCGSYDRTVSIWEVAENASKGFEIILRQKEQIMEAPIRQVLVTENGIYACSEASGRLVKVSLHDLSTEMRCNVSCRGLSAFALAGKVDLIAFGTDFNLRLCHLDEPVKDAQDEQQKPFGPHSDWISCIAASPCTPEVATGSIDGKIVVWDSKTGELKRAYQCEGYQGNLFVFSKDGQFLLSRVGAWDANHGQRVPYLNIAKDNRSKLEANVGITSVPSYLNYVVLNERSGFATHDADKVTSALLPINDLRSKEVLVCCSGKSVEFFEVQTRPLR